MMKDSSRAKQHTTGFKKPRFLTIVAELLVVGFLTGHAAPRNNKGIEGRVDALLNKMTLEEKIGQMTQADIGALKDKTDARRYYLGSVLAGGDSDPENNAAITWLNTTRQLQEQALKTRLQIPVLFGIDAVHGHNNVEGAVIFPHNIGMGAAGNPDLVEKAAAVTSAEVAGTGMHWVFAPCVAVARDIRWGRSYESYSEQADLVSALGAAAVRGAQAPLPGGLSVLACAKHYVGDGATADGVDQGNATMDEAALRKLHLAPYKAAIRAGVGSIMVSYSSWNGEKLHGHRHLLTDVLKGELGFKGFLVSDWAAIDQLSDDYKVAIEKSINAGLDMVMIPNGPGKKNNYVEFITTLKQLVGDGLVAESRIDDAVRRILRAKIAARLFEHPFGEPKMLEQIGSAQHREVARACVRESLVLLKNDNSALPLSKNTPRLVVMGHAADDLGMQCGGWTIQWQGRSGTVTKGGTTILAAVKQAVGSKTEVVFSPDGHDVRDADAVLVVIGEQPYAEMKGDRGDLQVSAQDMALVRRARETGAPVVTVVLSGRPLVLGSVLEHSSALIAAWLPGTEGKGITDVLFGDFKPAGKLPRFWPGSNNDLVSAQPGVDHPGALFPCGFGLSYDVPGAAGK
jgi:beta-glucosidase